MVDTDRIAHEIVEPGQPGLKQIEQVLGAAYIGTDGRLDRRKLRQAIFADGHLRARLEAILHPLIGQEAVRQVAAADYPYCLLVIPLYTKSVRWAWIDRVLTVDVAESTQLERVMRRDRIDHEQAEAILAAQASREERLTMADDVIDNSGSLDDLDAQVEALHQEYLELSRRR